ncbi:MAG: hypothetical protein V1807_02825 [Patescibacteria group bacterium]
MTPTDNELMLDVGQANELKLAFRRAGYTNAEIKKLCEGDILATLLPVIKGNAEVVTSKHIIDCDADPFLPTGWKVEQHNKGGQFALDTSKIHFYLSKGQKNGKTIGGNKLRKELQNKPVLNANVLDWLLDHPEFIPEEWKSKYVFFWGTIYRSAGGHLVVRSLHWHGTRWDWNYDYPDDDWYGFYPAALSASI